jgi:hypothetical protein
MSELKAFVANIKRDSLEIKGVLFVALLVNGWDFMIKQIL